MCDLNWPLCSDPGPPEQHCPATGTGSSSSPVGAWSAPPHNLMYGRSDINNHRKHRRSCQRFPGHSLTVSHKPSMSGFKFPNLSGTVNCVTFSHQIAPNVFVFGTFVTDSITEWHCHLLNCPGQPKTCYALSSTLQLYFVAFKGVYSKRCGRMLLAILACFGSLFKFWQLLSNIKQ